MTRASLTPRPPGPPKAAIRRAARPGERKRIDHAVDFYGWTQEQAALIEAGRLSETDVANVAEELRDLGRHEFRALESAYRVLLLHLLKWDHQTERRGRSLALSIQTQRDEARDLLQDSPGLKSRRDEAFLRAYRKARLEAAAETGLPLAAFPERCPYSLDDALARDIPVD